MRKLLLALVTCLGCAFVLFVVSANAQNLTGVILQNENLRAGPGTNFAIVGRVPQGQSVEIIGRNDTGDWYKLAGEQTMQMCDSSPIGWHSLRMWICGDCLK